MSESIAAGVFKVELTPLASTLQPTSRRIRIEVITDGRVIEQGEHFEILKDDITRMMRTPTTYKQVTIRVVDVDTLETLDEKTASINLEGYDNLL